MFTIEQLARVFREPAAPVSGGNLGSKSTTGRLQGRAATRSQTAALARRLRRQRRNARARRVGRGWSVAL